MGLVKTQDLEAVKERMRRLRPSQSKGVLTSQTTRGVHRIASTAAKLAARNSGFTPRWG